MSKPKPTTPEEAVTRRAGWKVGLAAFGGYILGAATVLLVLWLYSDPGERRAARETAGRAAKTMPPGATEPAQPAPSAPQPTPPTISTPAPVPPAPVYPGGSLDGRSLLVPVQGIRPDQLQNTFDDARSGGRVHEALDIMAPRDTPVVAVEDGRVAKLFTSAQGGLTIYQFDPSETYSYYYAHLERYADGLQEGDPVRRGQVLGYVGTSGNAAPDGPHLHFAIFRLNEEKDWWKGTPVNPYSVLRGEGG
ncbi:MAG TPA: M23 family metallopeptidase [Thermoanaerobaculia bacterium]|nr:M23 family metallopeptidase [Thermoanaerobaculia bacterium]